MFQKKKGFTLIELLAVIVILAVIALIATPLIMNVINDAKKNSFKDSTYGIIKAVEIRAMEQDIEGLGGTYKVTITGENSDINHSGEKPTQGIAIVDSNGNVKVYMCNDSYCATNTDTSDNRTTEVRVETGSTEMNAIKTKITQITADTTIPNIGDAEPAGPTAGYSYTPKTGDETYAGILYLDPTDLTKECDATSATNNKQGIGYSCTKNNTTHMLENCVQLSEPTLTGTKTGCMKWFAFGDDGNGNPTTAILDHNTTAIAVYDFEDKNSEANGRVANDYEADWQLAQDTSNWDSSLSARFPTADEIASAGGLSSVSHNYFGGGNSASQNGKYWWLYTNLNGVEMFNGRGNDNANYQYYSNASGSTSPGLIYGYWTSTPKASYIFYVWGVCNSGSLDDGNADNNFIGVRPVISLSSLSLTN